MSDCEMMTVCIFFNDKMANMPSTAGMLKRKYCQGDFALCARHIVCAALGVDKIPADLTPSESDRARQIIV